MIGDDEKLFPLYFTRMFQCLRKVPSFPIMGYQISILYKPEEFYQTLLSLCARAKKRIILTTLYIGTGPLEQELVNVIEKRMKEKRNEALNVRILLDGHRGSRGISNSRTLLMPMLKANPSCQVALYHTPQFKRFLYKIVPNRYNELIGLQHMKIYVVDDHVIISGANLSEEYFTVRQDRYMLIKDKNFADFYDGLTQTIGEMSMQLGASNDLMKHPKCRNHPFSLFKWNYVTEFREKITKYYDSFLMGHSSVKDIGCDTRIYPLIELPPLGIHGDSSFVKNLLNHVGEYNTVHLATGYFNITEEYSKAILTSKATFNILVAHPTANGFLNSPGLSGYIPSMYTLLAENFWKQIGQAEAYKRIKLYEYKRSGWTYHAKGIWITLPGVNLPNYTMIGSSNYGDRSKSRDLENEVIVETTNEELTLDLRKERDHLFGKGVLFNIPSGDDVRPPFWMKYFAWLFKSYF